MAAPDNSSSALPSREELNRTLLRPPFICRFCGAAGGDFLGLLVHSLGVHPINYLLLREHLEAHGSDDGFRRAQLPLPEHPRVPPPSPSPTCARDVPTPLQDEFEGISDDDRVDSARDDMETPDLNPSVEELPLAAAKPESPEESCPVESLRILSEDLGDDGAESDTTANNQAPTKTEKRRPTAPPTPTKSPATKRRHSPPPKVRSRRSSSRGRRRSPAPPRRKRGRSSEPVPSVRIGTFTYTPSTVDARSIRLRVQDSGKRARRCQHNEEPCRVFPNCLGRHCSRRHPPCGSHTTLCLRRNDCPFEHCEYEKTCGECREREPPPHTHFLTVHCPHRKTLECRYKKSCQWTAEQCHFVHGECKNLECHKGQSCYYEHISEAIYFCPNCQAIKILKHK